MRDIDPIIGIRRFREQFAAAHDYDIRAMSATLRRISEEHGHSTVSPAAEAVRESPSSPSAIAVPSVVAQSPVESGVTA